MSLREEYITYINALRLPNISGIEVVRPLGNVRGGVKNSIPPKSLWKHIVPVLWTVQYYRTFSKLPVQILSTYRSPAYNQAVGGASSSYHMRNAACDFRVSGRRPLTVFDRLEGIRAAGSFRGGLGLYRTFVHVDHRGRNANFGNALDSWMP